MKTSFMKEYTSIYSKNNIKSNKFFKNSEQYKSSTNPLYQPKKNSVQFISNIPKYNSNTYFNPQKSLNPTHMKFSNGSKKVFNQFFSQSQEKENEAKNNILKKSAVFNQNINRNKDNQIPQKKKMGISQLNFYNKKNNMNLFPNIQYNKNNNNNFKEKEN